MHIRPPSRTDRIQVSSRTVWPMPAAVDRVGDARPLGRRVREPGQVDEPVAHDLIAPQRARGQRRVVHVDDDAADREQPDEREDRIDHPPQPALVGDDEIVTSGLQQPARLPERAGAHVLRVGTQVEDAADRRLAQPLVLDDQYPENRIALLSPCTCRARDNGARSPHASIGSRSR